MKQEVRQFVKRHRLLLATAEWGISWARRGHDVIYWAISPLLARRYLNSHQVRKLQIGAGPNVLPGWLNTDKSSNSPRVLFLDAARPFPLRDATVDYIYSEHLIEHLTYKHGQLMLRECFRVLRPGGWIRLATPDLETLIGLHTAQKSEMQQRYIQWVVDKFLPEVGVYHESVVINNAFRNYGHQFLYDYHTLKVSLENAGFIDITRHDVGESDDEVLRGIESHGLSARDEEINRFETMVLEARRPL